jgi:hypothetical protein
VLLDEAITSGALPRMDFSGPLEVNMRGWRPSLAEVYTLGLLAAIKRRADAGWPPMAPIALLVPPFDRNDAYWPSYVRKLERCAVCHPSGQRFGMLFSEQTTHADGRMLAAVRHSFDPWPTGTP